MSRVTNTNKSGQMFDIVKFCENKKNCATVQYSKVVTGGNDPSMSTKMKYSQYVNKAKPKMVQLFSGDYISNVNLFIQTYANKIHINISTSNYEQQTIDFVNGHLNANQYYDFIKLLFPNNLVDVLNGIYPLLPLPKSFYLKRYADIVLPFGNVMPYFRQYSFIRA